VRRACTLVYIYISTQGWEREKKLYLAGVSVGRVTGQRAAAPCSPVLTAERVNNKLKVRDEFSKRYLRYIKKEKKDDGSAFLFSLLCERASPSCMRAAPRCESFYYYILSLSLSLSRSSDPPSA
jgi:hypothetical protein